MTAAPLIGRDQELRVIAGIIARASRQGQAVTIVGDPGIGKSALVGAAEEAAGAAGYQVAALYLSPRTIGSHLYRIFPKLGITSRTELVSRLQQQAAVAAGQ